MESATSRANTTPRIREVEDFLDIEGMRKVRNQVRGFMTHNTSTISRQQQMDWYTKVYLPARSRNELIGFIIEDSLDVIGYGLISRRDEKYWVSGGLVEAARGRKIGEMLFANLTDYIHYELEQEEAWLDVREDNPAQHLYTKLGYMALEQENGLILMVHEQEPGTVQHEDYYGL